MLLTDTYVIYAQARAYFERARYPVRLAYQVVVAVTERGVVKTVHYDTAYDSRHGVTYVDATSAEERAHPHVPPGGFNLFGRKPEDSFDYLGVPKLAPNYSFGMAKYVAPTSENSAELIAEVRDEYHDPARRPYLPQTGGLKEIVAVQSLPRDYTITLQGIVPYRAHSDYHLRLQPTHDPRKYRLRQLWIDTRSFATDRLESDGNFTAGPGPGVSWDVTYVQRSGAPYIEEERAEAPLSYEARVYTDATVSFASVTPTPYSALDQFSQFATSRDTLEEP